MFLNRSGKRQIIVLSLAILFCVGCLTGATLALFTNEPEKGTIGVVTVAGNVKMDIVDASDSPQSLVGSVLDFQTSGGQREVRFEPGASFCTQGFRMKNDGTVTLNFRLSISEDEQMDMEAFEEAFELWITTDPTDLNGATRITSFTDRLEPGQSTGIYYLILRMKETAGNDFQGAAYSGIGVTAYAVQGNVHQGQW